MKRNATLRGKVAKLLGRLQHRLDPIPDFEQQVPNNGLEVGRLAARIGELERTRTRLLTRLGMSLSSGTRRRPIPVALALDIEPDRRVVDPDDPSWQATPVLFDKWERLRKSLARTSGLPVTWFPRADPQVEKANGSLDWALRQFRTDWDRLLEQGDEIGLLMHPWRWDAAGHWTQDYGDDAWVIYCLRSALTAFRQIFEKGPAAYRGGDRFLNGAVAQILIEEGVEVDLTLERLPGVARLVTSEHGTGAIPDGLSVPRNAYRASPADVRVPVSGNSPSLGMLPLTDYAEGTLVPWLPNRIFAREIDRLLEEHDSGSARSHLAFAARSDLALLPQWEDFALNISSLVERAEEGELVFLTASEAWRTVSLLDQAGVLQSSRSTAGSIVVADGLK